MEKQCRVSKKPFSLTEQDLFFYEKVSPVINGKKYLIPPPSLSPEERLRKRWVFRNEHALYNNKCAKTGKPLVAMFPPTLPITIYEQKLWWDKSWDGTEYGRDFDFSRPFFAQYAELLRAVPHPNLLNDALSNENSDYVNCTISLKNCYMLSDAGSSEDCYYSNIINSSKNCVDCTAVVGSEMGYELIGSLSCYNSKFLLNCDNCRDSAFLYACKSCSNCFGCYNLRHKEYCWYNEQLTKEEFEKRLAKVDLGNYETYQRLKEDFLVRIQAAPREYAFLMGSENCTGNVVVRSHNTHVAFDCDGNQDSKYTISTTGIRDTYDIEHTYNAELCLEVMAATNIYQNLFSFYTINSQNIFYSYLASAASNCFGCAGIKNQQYCILNKKYSKEAYEELVPRIIEHMKTTGEWGEFFPMSVSLHGYNESLAVDYFPLTKAEALTMSANWNDYEAPKPSATQVLTANQLPASIQEVTDEILQQVVQCASSGKLFKITKQELQFYRAHNIPLPRVCHDVRYQERLKLRLPRRLWPRQCDCLESGHDHTARCEHQFETPYAPDQPERIYCEKCYQKVVT
ncbi:MAG: hypothetical protein HY817_02210 [Candidatus Abawacabacteria bacterium]|nr:hypothetical protein [Candidatus Abawacabacteria bacterium]